MELSIFKLNKVEIPDAGHEGLEVSCLYEDCCQHLKLVKLKVGIADLKGPWESW
jgi:hypothetical protein